MKKKASKKNLKKSGGIKITPGFTCSTQMNPNGSGREYIANFCGNNIYGKLIYQNGLWVNTDLHAYKGQLSQADMNEAEAAAKKAFKENGIDLS